MANAREEFEKFKSSQATGVASEFEEFKKQKLLQDELFKFQQSQAGQKQITPLTSQVPSPEEQRALSGVQPTEGLLEDFPVGATTGAEIGTAIGGFPIGTAGGALAGGSLQQIFEIFEQRGITGDIPLIGGEKAPAGPTETTQRLKREVVEQVLGQGIFKGLASIARGTPKRLLSAPFAKSLDPAKREAAELLLRENIPFTPFDINEMVVFGRLEKFQEQAFISSGIMKKFNKEKIKAVEAFAERGLGDIGLKKQRESLGKMTQAVIEDTVKNLENNASRLFKQASLEAGETATIPTGPIKRAAQEIKEIEKLVKLPKATKEDTGLLTEFGKTIFKETETLKSTELNFKQLESLADDLLGMGDNITFEQARAFQKRLGRKIANLKGLPEGEAKLLYRGFAEAIEQIPNPNALETLNVAKNLFKKSLNFRENTLMNRLANKNPEDIFKTVFKPEEVTDIKALRSVIPKSDWNIYQAALVDDIFKRSGQSFKNVGSVLKKFTDETLEAALDKDQIDFLKNLDTIVETIRLPQVLAGQKVRPGVSLVNMVRGNMAINALKKVGTGLFSAGTIMLGPPAIAKIITSKGGVKLLTTGLTMKGSHPQAAKIISQLIDMAGGTATRAGVAATSRELRKRQPRGAVPTTGFNLNNLLGSNQNAL